MNRKILLVFCLACVATCSLFYVNAGVNGFRDQSTPIDLKGKLDGMGEMRTQGQPVGAFQYDTYVQLNFLVNEGALEIAVADGKNEPVFQTMVNATAGSDLPIDTSNWASGEYTLVITDGLGGSLVGNFVIER